MDVNRLKNLAISETGFLFDPATGNTFTLNDSAVFILRALQADAQPAEIPRRLCREFAVGENQASEDVTDALLQLREAGLVGGLR